MNYNLVYTRKAEKDIKKLDSSIKSRISDIPESDRPREKLLQTGAEALSDIELLAILLGSGTKGHDVMTAAERILKVLDAHNEKLNGKLK